MNPRFKKINDIIDSNFADLCISASRLTVSEKKISDYYSWAKNPYDKWFSRIFNINIPKHLMTEVIGNLREEIERGEAPHLLLMRDGLHDEALNDVLRSNNFTMFYQQTGMAIELSELGEQKSNDFHDIREINTPAAFEEWNEVVEQVFGNRKNQALYHLMMKGHSYTFFGYYQQNKLVATTLLYMQDDIAGVHLVGTVKDARGKGIGTQITTRAFDHARKKGATIGVLQASPMGNPMYKKIGFKSFSNISHWEYKSPSQQ